MDATTVAIDLAKDVFEIALADANHRIIKRLRLSRGDFALLPHSLSPATVVMEACATSHYWARLFREAGHSVRLLPAHYVRPYRKRNKTDRADAAALVQAARDPDILPVAIKTEYQQSIMALHRIRSAWVATRTARINLVRGLLREFGILLPSGAANVIPGALVALSDRALPLSFVEGLLPAIDEIRELDARIDALDKQLAALARQSKDATRLQSIPGIGVMTATALAASVGDAQQFRSGRHMASWLGLTPRESSSGSKRHLGSISKRGDVYLRKLLIHGARSALLQAKRVAKREPGELTKLQAWVLALEQRVGHNKAAVALANKIARIAWAIWRHDRPFNGSFAAA
nr:IS110 family transposase [Oceanococcus sp. HetDA_MAG_MS8]